ncbi:MAG TPA: hypothetical protein VLG71_03630, partial [Candidatus Limnocylindria bacterium]|nr:hypothetical protein [Candidatus Limnocylindria bacterium]
GAASSKETSASAAATVAQAPTVNAAGAAPVVEVDQSLFSEASRVSLTRNAETARILELLRAQLTSKRTSAARSATTVKGSMVRGYRRSHAFETGKAARDRSSNSPARLAQAAAAPATTTALAASPARVAATGGSTSTTTATRRVAAPASAAAAAAPTSASDQYYPPNGSTPWGGTIYR